MTEHALDFRDQRIQRGSLVVFIDARDEEPRLACGYVAIIYPCGSVLIRCLHENGISNHLCKKEQVNFLEHYEEMEA